MLSPTYHPFDHIPDEIISDILEWVSIELQDHQARFLFPLQTPQLVSRRWRTITHSTPKLWSYLSILSRYAEEDIARYASKSGAILLNVVSRGRNFSALPRLIAVCCERLEGIRMWEVPLEGSDLEVAGYCDHEMAINSSSYLQYFSYFSGETSMRLDCIASISTSLRSLRIYCVLLGTAIRPCHALLFQNLTELVLDVKFESETGVDDLFKLLQHSTLLRRLILSSFELETKSLEKIALPKLQELFLLNFFPGEIALLLLAIKSPNLKLLALESSESITTEFATLPDGFSVDYPELEEVDILGVETGGFVTLREILTCLPPVSCLGMGGYGYSVDHEQERGFDGTALGLLEGFTTEIKVLKTRGFGVLHIQKLVKESLINVRRVVMYDEDVDDAELMSWNQDQNIDGIELITRSDGEDEVWYPADIDRQESWFASGHRWYSEAR